jgi:sortase (surface protein transpeptidase)
MQPHKATIGADGSIILPGMQAAQQQLSVPIEEEVSDEVIAEFVVEESQNTQNDWSLAATDPEEMWTVIEEEIDVTSSLKTAAEASKRVEQAKAVWSSVRENVRDIAGDVLEESRSQYLQSLADGRVASVEATRSLHGSLGRFWVFLKQPVWIPNRKKQPVQYSRGTLFMIDTVRFGGTFAMLFGVLFAALNYQSFITIAGSYITPLAEVTGIVQAQDSDEEISEKLKDLSNPESAESGDLSQYLPPVGPPENRLVIPKLKLNVPIVIPSVDALIAEDWTVLEKDIQTGLQDGVVHYPGTARPGKPGNFFLTGHSSYYPWAPGAYKSVFARLHDLNVGDEYWVFYNGMSSKAKKKLSRAMCLFSISPSTSVSAH